MRIGAKRAAVLLPVTLLVFCDSGGSHTSNRPQQSAQQPVSISYEQVGFHPGNRADLGTYFVAAEIEGVPNDQAKRDFLNIGRSLCRGKSVCFVHFWSDLTKAARSIPMTDAQVAAQIASYNSNRNTGNDRLTCHPFGSPGERCG